MSIATWPRNALGILEFLDKIHNHKRLHSALGYLPLSEFEANRVAQNNKDAAARKLPS